MSNYKKFTLETIKKKLKDGDYEAPVGAMRAIGKTQELSEKEKEKARELVRKHFGVEAPAPKAARAKKAAKKSASKTVPKADKDDSAPIARKKKAAKKPAAAAPVSKKMIKKTRRAKPSAVSEGDTDSSNNSPTTATKEDKAAKFTDPGTKPSLRHEIAAMQPRSTIVAEMGQVISTISDSLKAMEVAKLLVPKSSLEHDVKTATCAMARAVKIIDQEVMAPRLRDEAIPAVAKAASGRKKASKKGTRTKTVMPAQQETETEESTEELTDASEDPVELSEEEQEQLRLARETQAVASSG